MPFRSVTAKDCRTSPKSNQSRETSIVNNNNAPTRRRRLRQKSAEKRVHFVESDQSNSEDEIPLSSRLSTNAVSQNVDLPSTEQTPSSDSDGTHNHLRRSPRQKYSSRALTGAQLRLRRSSRKRLSSSFVDLSDSDWDYADDEPLQPRHSEKKTAKIQKAPRNDDQSSESSEDERPLLLRLSTTSQPAKKPIHNGSPVLRKSPRSDKSRHQNDANKKSQSEEETNEQEDESFSDEDLPLTSRLAMETASNSSKAHSETDEDEEPLSARRSLRPKKATEPTVLKVEINGVWFRLETNPDKPQNLIFKELNDVF